MKQEREGDGEKDTEEVIIPKVGRMTGLDEETAKRNMYHIKFKGESADRFKSWASSGKRQEISSNKQKEQAVK